MPAVGFGFSFGLVIIENPGIDPKIKTCSLSLLLALKLFIESLCFRSIFVRVTINTSRQNMSSSTLLCVLPHAMLLYSFNTHFFTCNEV